MLTPDSFRAKFSQGLPYREYVKTGKPAHQDNWNTFHASVSLTNDQQSLVRSFSRKINVLVSSGTWCGDCVQQCPILERIEAANPNVISLRLLDRDEHKDLSEPLMICGGFRVPTVVFLNEDFEFLSLTGDRTLSRYRAIAAKQLGPSCPLPGAPVPKSEVASAVADWAGEFERVHLMLRLSPKLRERYAD